MSKSNLMPSSNRYEIYRLMLCSDNSGWFYPNYDHYGYPHKDFSPSGRCWQETSIFGTFEREIALEALLNMLKKSHPGIIGIAVVKETRTVNIEPIYKMEMNIEK